MKKKFYFEGECHGNLIHLEDSATKEDCLQLCKSNHGTFILFFPRDHLNNNII